jgi:spore coat polysaccharide biosynthesis protein SpsF
MRKAIFITVRAASTRLPKKCYMTIKGKPTIEYVIAQAKKSKLADIVVLCTTKNKEDDELCKIATKNGITYFRGSEKDKLVRWQAASRMFNIDFFVTADGDDLFCSHELFDIAFKQYNNSKVDFIEGKDIVCGSFTYGIKTSALNEVCHRKLTEDTEMMWTYFKDTGIFKTAVLENVPEVYKREDIRMTLDYSDDMSFFTKVIEALNKDEFSTRDVLQLIDSTDDLKDINFYLQEAWSQNQKSKTSLKFK